MTILELPWPPSVNHYWRWGNGHMYLSAEGKRYKSIVAGIVRCAGVSQIKGPVSLWIQAYPPDRRVRDLDNVLKALLDATGKAGLFRDDSQVKHIRAWMLEPVAKGRVVVQVAALDQTRDGPTDTTILSH